MTLRAPIPGMDNHRAWCLEGICETGLLAASKAALIELIPARVSYREYADLMAILLSRESVVIKEVRVRALFKVAPPPSTVGRLTLFTPTRGRAGQEP